MFLTRGANVRIILEYVVLTRGAHVRNFVYLKCFVRLWQCPVIEVALARVSGNVFSGYDSVLF